MPRYIDADVLLEEIRSYSMSITGLRCGKGILVQFANEYQKSILKMIHEQPTADVVEVVRCSDCAVPHNRWTGCPILDGLTPPPEFFCSFGLRKPKTADATAAGNGD